MEDVTHPDSEIQLDEAKSTGVTLIWAPFGYSNVIIFELKLQTHILH